MAYEQTGSKEPLLHADKILALEQWETSESWQSMRNIFGLQLPLSSIDFTFLYSLYEILLLRLHYPISAHYEIHININSICAVTLGVVCRGHWVVQLMWSNWSLVN